MNGQKGDTYHGKEEVPEEGSAAQGHEAEGQGSHSLEDSRKASKEADGNRQVSRRQGREVIPKKEKE